MWYVENVQGKKKIRKYFETYEEARAYSQWTLGRIGKEDNV